MMTDKVNVDRGMGKDMAVEYIALTQEEHERIRRIEFLYQRIFDETERIMRLCKLNNLHIGMDSEMFKKFKQKYGSIETFKGTLSGYCDNACPRCNFMIGFCERSKQNESKDNGEQNQVQDTKNCHTEEALDKGTPDSSQTDRSHD